jgi:protein O-GlcNAc transferase
LKQQKRFIKKLYNPSHFGAYLNLANNLVFQNKIDSAIEKYQVALQLNPKNNDIQINLDRLLSSHDRADRIYLKIGDYFFYESKYETASIQYQKSLESNQENVNLYLKLSECFRRLRKLEEAISILDRGINAYPFSPELYCLKILSLRDFGEFEKAKILAEISCNLIPENLSLQILRNLILPIVYNCTEEIINCRQNFLKGLKSLFNNLLLDTPKRFKDALEGLTWQTNFYLHYQGLNDLEIQIQYGAFLHKIMAANYPQWSQPLSMPPLSKSGKIRVGYISTCMHNHVVGRLFLGWLKNANRNQFEIYCYSLTKRQDSITQQFQVCSDRFYCFDDQLESVCETVIAARLHILVFLDLGMSPDIMQIASLRLAPVQCKAWGPPITSGLPTIDYFLSSDLMEPEKAESHYSEQLVRLPNLGFSFAKSIIPKLTKTRSDFQIPNEAIVYFSGQSLFKYLPQYDYIFVEIAKQVPLAKFIFISSQVSTGITQQFQHRLQQAFAKESVSFDDFCLVLPRLSQRDYWNILQLSDIFLDPLSWSGGATTLEAIGCQLPIVTYPGDFLRGRHAYGILKMLDVVDTIARNEADYISIAVKLGINKDWQNEILKRMNELKDRLYDNRVCVFYLEEFYRKLVSS